MGYILIDKAQIYDIRTSDSKNLLFSSDIYRIDDENKKKEKVDYKKLTLKTRILNVLVKIRMSGVMKIHKNTPQ